MARFESCVRLGLMVVGAMVLTLFSPSALPQAQARSAVSQAAPSTSARFDPATSTVVKRSDRETDYLNADGTHTALLASHPVNYMIIDQSWQPIDNRLQADPAAPGGLVNSANSWHAHFGSTGRGITVETPAGQVGMVPVGASDVPGSLAGSGDGVDYLDVWPGADLKYRVVDDAVKESVLIKTASAGSAFRFQVSTGPLGTLLANVRSGSQVALTRHSDGSVSFQGALAQQLTIAAPQVLRADGEPMEGAHAKLSVVGDEITLSVDPVWLAHQPVSAFPINLDPTLFQGTNASWSFKTDGYSCANCGVQFGNARDGGDTLWRTVAHYPYESLFGDEIIDATVQTGWQGGTQNAYGVRVFWASSYSYAGAAGHPNVLATGTPGGGSSMLSGAALSLQVKQWADGRVSNAALGFVGTDTAGLYTYQKYDTDLQVDYNLPPSTPTSTGFKSAMPSAPGCLGGTIDGTQDSALQAKLVSPSGRLTQGSFQYWDAATPTAKVTFPLTGKYTSGATNPMPFVTIGGNALTNGHNYYWHVQGYDGLKYGPWSGNCAFHVTDPVANAPTNPGYGPFDASLQPAQPCNAYVSPNQQLTLGATIADPNHRQVHGLFSLTWTPAGGSLHTLNYTTSGYQGSGTVALWPLPAGTISPSTAFTWTVQAQASGDTTKSLVTKCGGTTTSGQLPMPSQSAQLTNGSIGSVGQSVPLSFSDLNIDGSDAGAQEYVYSFDGTLPSPLPACPTVADVSAGRLAGATCAATGSVDGTPWDTVQITVPSTSFAISLWAVDAAGAVSPVNTRTYVATEVYGAVSSHLWDTASAVGSPPTGTTLDDAQGAGQGDPLPLTLSATGASWLGSGGPFWLDGAPPGAGPALHFDGSQGWAGTGTDNPAVPLNTSDNQWDATDDFSVQLWVRPAVASTASSGWSVAASQDGSLISGFLLGLHAGDWAFCMPATQDQPTDGSFDGDCAEVSADSTVSAPGGYVGQWTLLTGVWDASDHKMQLFVSTSLGDPSLDQPTAVVTQPHSISPPGYGEFSIGRGEFNGSNGGFFNGDIAEPTTYQGLVQAADAATTATYGPSVPGLS